ncbi:MAG: hypothetical protein EOO52_01265 [Gammaproteobacteria bacterium]|nr:MAG: hypothetical protein EOO52_01265 [Gammaproteobacteria bacterium]
MLFWLIVGCEIGFWILLFLGLFTRYVLKSPRFGKAVLLFVPLLDLILLCATTIDLHNGATAEFAHGLAAVYLGFTLVYASGLIKWADQYVANKFSTVDKVVESPIFGWDYTIYEWKQWLKGVGACAIAAVLLLLAIYYVNEPERTKALHDWFYSIFWILVTWLVCWPLWYTLFPKKNANH